MGWSSRALGWSGLVSSGLALACTLDTSGLGEASGTPATSDPEATAGTASVPTDGSPSDSGPTPGSDSTSTTAGLDTTETTGDPEPFFRRELTIHGDEIPGTEPLVDFTVLVDLPGDEGLRHVDAGGHVLEPDAADLVFRDASMQPLAHETITYGSSNGRLLVWVRVPEIAAEADTTLWLDYGTPALVGLSLPDAWSDDYVGVWHFENPLVDGGVVLDSSVQGNHGTALDMDRDDVHQGRVGRGVGFTRANATIEIGGGALDLPGPVTFEGWGRMDGPLMNSGYQRLFNKGGANLRPLTFWVTDETIDIGQAALVINFDVPTETFDLYAGIPDFDYGQWHHYATVVGAPGGEVVLFVDGNRVDSGTYDFAIETDYPELYFGNWDSQGPSRRWNGIIDEFRFCDVTRTDEWIMASYTNQRTPAAFVTVGPEQAMP